MLKDSSPWPLPVSQHGTLGDSVCCILLTRCGTQAGYAGESYLKILNFIGSAKAFRLMVTNCGGTDIVQSTPGWYGFVVSPEARKYEINFFWISHLGTDRGKTCSAQVCPASDLRFFPRPMLLWPLLMASLCPRGLSGLSGPHVTSVGRQQR